MSKFFYPVNILSQKKELHFTELSCADYKVANKMIVNNDLASLAIYFDQLLKELCLTPDEINHLTALDKFYCLVYVYALNVVSSISLSLTCPSTQKKFNTKLDLIKVLEQLESLKLEHQFSITEQNIQYHFTLPRTFLVEFKEDEIFKHCFTGLFLTQKNQVISAKEIPHLEGVLPFTVVREAWKWLSDILEEFQKFQLLHTLSPYVKEDVWVNYTPNLFSADLLQFLVTIYQDNLHGIYQQEYNLITKQNLTLSDLHHITPAELNIWESFEPKNKNSSSSLPSTPPDVK